MKCGSEEGMSCFSLSLFRAAVGLALVLGLVFEPGDGFAAEEKPNVVVFFVDDMGWTDLGCFGSDFYETPNIDRLAEEGVKFTNAYAACTVCSPSRAALLTGKYPARLHVTDFIPGHPIVNTPLTIPEWTQELELDEVTIAELLKEKGYRTAHFGKWHLTPRVWTGDPNSDGNYPEYYPDRQGFDLNIGGCERGAPASYFWPYGRGNSLEKKKDNNTFRTLPAASGGEGVYLTDQLAAEAVKAVEEFGDDPFFFYFPFYNVHTPLQGRPDLVAKYEKKLAANPDVKHANVQYAAMVENVDEAIGRVIEAMEKSGALENSLIIFTSDNGGLSPQATTNAPLRQGKGTIYEGGVRVPAIVRWPGKAKAGAVSDEPIITVDIFPTIAEAVGLEIDEEVDGLSLRPVLENPETNDLGRVAIFWHYPHYHMMGGIPHSAVRMGDWKLIERHGDPATLELYHLAEDIHEDHNLADSDPERAKAMQQRLAEWRKSVDAQMPTVNADYDPSKPTGWQRAGTSKFRGMDAPRQ